MFIEDSAAITAAIRAGSIQQIQAEPARRATRANANTRERVLVHARVQGSSSAR